MKKAKVLLVDDDNNILLAFKRQLRESYHIETATSGKKALELLATDGQFSVLVSDMKMPEMNGIELFMEVQEQHPDIVRIMLTGDGDQDTAIKAVNQGSIYRFVNKPCSSVELDKILKSAVKEHEIQAAERELLQNTLSGSVKLLTDVLSMVDPASFGMSMSVRNLARQFSSCFGIKNSWDIELAAMLSQIGSVVLPAQVSAKRQTGEKLTQEEQKLLDEIPKTGFKLLSNIPRLERVAEYVLYQNTDDGVDLAAEGKKIPKGAKILRILKDLEELTRGGVEQEQALDLMLSKKDKYDHALLSAAKGFIAERQPTQKSATTEYAITIEDLCPGQKLMADVKTVDGVLLVTKGNIVSETLMARIKNYSKLVGIDGAIVVDSKTPTI